MKVIKNMKLPPRNYGGRPSSHPDLEVGEGFENKTTSKKRAENARGAAWAHYHKRGQTIETRVSDSTLYVRRSS